MFIIFLITFLILIHIIPYDFLVRIFDIDKLSIKIVLLLLLFLFTSSFIISAIISRFQHNFLTKFLNIFSSVWLGLLINLFFGIIIFWVIILVLKLAKFNYDFLFLGTLFSIFIFLFTAWGMINAYYPKEKDLTINIEGLPEEWVNKKIVHLSDVHLGNALGKRYFSRLVKKINEASPDIIFITGDLFNGMDHGVFGFFQEIVNKLSSKKGIYFVTGNHEGYLGLTEPLSILKKTNIRVLDNEIMKVDGLEIIGLSYAGFEDGESEENKRSLKNIIEENKNFDRNMPSILLYHTPTSLTPKSKNNGSRHNQLYWSPNVNFTAAKDLGINLQLSGHTHRGQIFPFNFLANYIYKGYNYGLHQDDNFQIYISSGAGVWGPVMRTWGRSEYTVITLKQK